MFKRVPVPEGIYPPFFSRYLEQEAGIVNFFNGKFREEESYIRRAYYLQERSFPQEVRELLVELNRNLMVQPQGDWEEKVRDRRTLFVITGQQPGLFAGPLLVLYKGLTAVKLARRLEELMQVPVQPLFWVATEDHNVAPLMRTFVPSPDGDIGLIRTPCSTNGLPAGLVYLDDGAVADTLHQLYSTSGAGRHYDEVLAWLSSAANGGKNNLAGWFMQIMSRLCAAEGLILFDPMQAAARNLYTAPLLQTLECSSKAHNSIAMAEAALKDAAFPLQVQRRGRESFIMITWEDRRYPLLREGEHYYTPKGELSLSRSELLTLIVEQPSIFSPGVLLRPLFQDTLFPTLAYVAGPGELAYFAQIKNLYAMFHMEMPILYPRMGVTLLEPSLKKIVSEHHINLDTLLTDLSKNARKQGGWNTLHLQLLCNNLWPRFSPQERVFNIVPYLIAYGFSFWNDFCEKFEGFPGHYFYCWKRGV